MLIIGLTGGIGSGKTTVSDMFFELGVDIIDADVIAREVTRTNTQVKDAIFYAFGEHLRTPDNQIDRQQLRNLIFTDPAKKSQLESITHPIIRTAIKQALSAPTFAPYKIYSSPLLLETHQQSQVHKLLVVDVPQQTQIDRTMQRDTQTQQQVQNILAAQFTRQERLKYADYIIDNNQSLSFTLEQVKERHNDFKRMAQHPIH